MRESVTIQKNPVVHESQQYAWLRQKGLDYIQQLGSRLWTDYNIHDPGITLLELLSYAITDLGNRSAFNIKDILAEPPFIGAEKDKAAWEKAMRERQGFFAARDILTVNPWTVNDFRKMLIDINGVKNAWLLCKQCPCDNLYLYANCNTSELQYEVTDHPVVIKGFYDVLVECEDDEGADNLNSGKVNYNFSFDNGGSLANAVLELRLPSWQKTQTNLSLYGPLLNPLSTVEEVTVKFISGNKEDNLDIPLEKLSSGLRRTLYATLEVKYAIGGSTGKILLSDVPFRVWFASDTARKALTLPTLKLMMEDSSAGGAMAKYVDKLHRVGEVMAIAKTSLHQHRNLCEDYCSIRAIESEDFAVCADLEVESFADIEAIMAEAFYQMDQYMRPDIRFYTLQQMLDTGKTMDEIFEGPPLQNGFIDDAQLNSTGLRSVLYTSDIVNLLMDIPGVKAVRNISLAQYDADGNLANNDPWSIAVSFQQQPALYIAGSKFLVFKDGLPFLPDRFELNDTMQVIRGRNAQPRFAVTENDVAIPTGTYYNLSDYYPLQYSLPLTYGVGYDGLPSNATPLRKAQAQQLKAYLLFYEQMLVNYLEQLAHVKELFAIDPSVDRTYFTHLLTNSEIMGVEGLYNGLNGTVLQGLNETETGMLERRNRFLDHQMARFAEQFTDYALMIYAYLDNNTLAGDKLIKNKIEFLKDYPFISANRGRSFHYKDTAAVCNTANVSGLQRRLQRLLGFRQLLNFYILVENKDADGNIVGRRWVITDQEGKKFLIAPNEDTSGSLLACVERAEGEITTLQDYITNAAAYTVVKKGNKWRVQLKDIDDNLLAEGYDEFTLKADAETNATMIQTFGGEVAAAEKVYVVEHLLLRPRNHFHAFELYEEKDEDNKPYERRWRLKDEKGKIYLSASTRYYGGSLAASEAMALREIGQVAQYITQKSNYEVAKGKQWYVNLLDDTGEVIATRKQHFKTKADAEAARDGIIAFAKTVFASQDPLLPICIPPPPECNTDTCGEEDPYSFRMTVVMNGELGIVNSDIVFRRFAEKTIREEVPAHLGVKICWVSTEQFNEFQQRYCKWLEELAKETPDAKELKLRFKDLMNVFVKLKNVYPEARLHDCVDGNDENRVLLGQTVIVDEKKLTTLK
jgi:hypothetical protein